MLRYLPGSSCAGWISYGCSNSSAVSPKCSPALNAARLASRTCGRDENRWSIHSIVGSTGRVYIHEMRPSAKKFFERSASRGFTPSSLHASSVMVVIGTWITRYADSEPSSSGLPS